mmetsp:Transcript_87385/g.154972  ORF Transcript_87385/g.154972 Transcript_87385/m.154972 type:complete len:225 (+) Transcript_87385:1653-2327(+)
MQLLILLSCQSCRDYHRALVVAQFLRTDQLWFYLFQYRSATDVAFEATLCARPGLAQQAHGVISEVALVVQPVLSRPSLIRIVSWRSAGASLEGWQEVCAHVDRRLRIGRRDAHVEQLAEATQRRADGRVWQAILVGEGAMIVGIHEEVVHVDFTSLGLHVCLPRGIIGPWLVSCHVISPSPIEHVCPILSRRWELVVIHCRCEKRQGQHDHKHKHDDSSSRHL